MTGDQFQIIIRTFEFGRPYRMTGELIYQTEQLVRCRVFSSERFMILEKNLTKKRFPWKITEMSFTIGKDKEAAAWAIARIQDQIDEYLERSDKEKRAGSAD